MNISELKTKGEPFQGAQRKFEVTENGQKRDRNSKRVFYSCENIKSVT